MAERQVRAFGDHGVLVGTAEGEDVLALAAMLSALPLAGQVELVPAAETLLVRHDRADPAGLIRELTALPVATPADLRPAEVVDIDVVYDGADLDEVGVLTGLGVAGVVAAHTGQRWTVAFGGFAPGFGYLVGDGRLTVPRRSSPRTRVPTGAVGLAGAYSGVYPRESPGGWQLIGRTAAPLWDLDREPPALLRPGVAVRFRAVDVLGEQAAPAEAPGPSPDGPGLEVVRPGILSTVQDAGRPGYAALGVTRSGSADQSAYARANDLVGNPAGAAVLETTLGGLRVRAIGAQLVAVTGAPVPVTVRRPDGSTWVPPGSPFRLGDGDVLECGTAPTGLRSYLAVRGGLDVPPVLGSRSTDLLSGLGPGPLTKGAWLPVGTASGAVPSEQVSPSAAAPTVPLAVTDGPHLDRLMPDAAAAFTGQTWQVTPRSNRVGLRLEGIPFDAATAAELPSAPLVAGAVQVPPSGQPVVFLRDHPTTGGYPVVAVLTDAAIDLAAQLRPGQSVRFVRQ